MSHTEQLVFMRWRVSEGVRLEALRARLGELGNELLAGARPALGGRAFDVDFEWEFRSQRPLVGAEEAYFRASSMIDAIWLRSRSGFGLDAGLADEDDDVDGINQIDLDCDRISPEGWRPCRYGFDEVVIAGAKAQIAGFVVEGEVQRWKGTGTYLTRNCSRALYARFDPVPGPALARPTGIDALALVGGSPFTQIEWRWRGRVVHAVSGGAAGVEGAPYRATSERTERGEHVCADDWDNCLDDVYLERLGHR